MLTFYLDGDAAGGGAGTQNSPYNSGAQLPHTGGLFADSVTLYFKAGATLPVPMNSTNAFRPPTSGSLLVRAYGGGTRPVLTFTGRGFSASGVGALLDIQDVELRDAGSASNKYTAVTSNTGGSLTLARSKLTGWFNHVKGGSGTVLVEDNECSDYSWNGIIMDVDPAYALGTNGTIRRNSIVAATDNVAGQDPLVLHDGGIGLGTGWVIEDNEIHAGNPESESGIDLQQQFRGTIVRRNRTYGASQWGFTQGSLFKVTRVMSTRSAMLAYFNREGYIGNPVLPGNPAPNVVNGGHCCWVTSDGANNGLYQLTGNDPRDLAAWTGPMTATDMLTLKTLVYENLFEGHGGGVQIQHPGTQVVANDVRGVTMAYNSTLGFYDMGYGAQVWDNEFETSGGASTSRALMNVSALESRISPVTRGTLKNNKFRMASSKTGVYINLASAADLSYLVTDHNVYTRAVLGSNVATVAGSSKTFAEWKSANGNDAHSQHITLAAALIDADGRLLDGSPLIGAGIVRSGLDASIPAVDVEGNPVSSPEDIGAYRYLSSADAAGIRATGRRLLRAQRTAVSVPPGPGSAPGAVNDLTLTGETATTLSFSWSEADGSGYYEMRFSTTNADPWETSPVHYADVAGTVSDLEAVTLYYVQVRGVNSAGAGPWSSSVPGTTIAGVWLRPQSSTDTAGFSGMPALLPKYMATGATSNPGAYANPECYTLLTDNGGAGGGVAMLAVDDDTARRMNAVLTMIGMASGRQWLVAQRASHQQSGVQSVYVCWGAHSSLASMWALQVSTAGDLGFMVRGLGDSASTTNTLTHTSGPNYSTYDNQGAYTIIISLRAVSAIAVDVEVRIVHSSVGTSVWNGSAIDCSFGGNAATLPGIITTAAAQGGLMLGGRMRSALSNYVPERLLGTGTGHIATLADFQAVTYADFNTARIDAAVAAVLADPTGWCLG